MKKVCALLLSLLFCFSALLPAFAAEEDFVIDGPFLREYKGDDDKVVVPEGVTRIKQGAFYGKSFSEIKLPSTLQFIEMWAFGYNENLKSITLPKSMEGMNEFVFDGCSALEEILVEPGCEKFQSVDGVLFRDGCTVLMKYPEGKSAKGYQLPDTVVKLWPGSFFRTDVDRITLPDSVETVHGYVFSECSELTEFRAGKNLKTLWGHVFSGSQKLKTVTLPASFEELENFTFDNCNALERIDVDPENPGFCSVDGVLYKKDMHMLIRYPEGKSAKGFRLPASVRELACNAFTRCDCESMDLSRLTEIEQYTFNECKSLRTVILGKDLTRIGQGAFVNSIVQDVYYAGTKEDWKNVTIEGDNNQIKLAATIHYESDLGAKERIVREGEPWRERDLPAKGATLFSGDWGDTLRYTIDDNGTLWIEGDGATAGYSKNELELGFWQPGTPLPIRSPFFTYWEDIDRVVIPAGVTVVGDNVFYGCSRIRDVYYGGTKEQWTDLDIRGGNEALTDAVIHFPAPKPKSIEAEPLPADAQVPQIDTGRFSLQPGLDGGNRTADFSYMYGQTVAVRTYFTLTTGDRGGSYILAFPTPNAADDLYEFEAAPHAAYRIAYYYPFTQASYGGGSKAVLRLTAPDGEELSREITVSGGSIRPGSVTVTLLRQDAAAEPDFDPGDVDGKDGIEVEDARLALRAAVGLEIYAPASRAFLAADTDGNGEIEVSDARNILRAAVGLDTPEDWR